MITKVNEMNNQAFLTKDTPWLQSEGTTRTPEIVVATKVKTRLRFKPRGIWPFLTWGFTIFLGCRVLLMPLAEGVYSLVVKSQELNVLKAEHQKMSQQLADMKKARDQMRTIAWVEEQSHKAGFIKINESPMMVIEELPEKATMPDVKIKD